MDGDRSMPVVTCSIDLINRYMGLLTQHKNIPNTRVPGLLHLLDEGQVEISSLNSRYYSVL